MFKCYRYGYGFEFKTLNLVPAGTDVAGYSVGFLSKHSNVWLQLK
jgi:hypothetical protein